MVQELLVSFLHFNKMFVIPQLFINNKVLPSVKCNAQHKRLSAKRRRGVKIGYL